jgi:predicted Fe-Mo cluster-binding NifX family protein
MKRMKGLFPVLILLVTSMGYAADRGKVAVAAEGKTTAAEVSGVAARSPYFLIFDGDGKLLEAVENPYRSAGGGAGTSVVPFLAQRGITVIVAGKFGGKMIRAMKDEGIGYLELRGTAEAAVIKALEVEK